MRRGTGIAVAAIVLSALVAPLGCDRGKPAGTTTPGKASLTPPPGLPEQPPVTVECLGLGSDKESLRYRVRVSTDRPVEQADVGLVYIGVDGKEERATAVWQNVVDAKRQPIERGKSYEAETRVGRGATGFRCRVLHVVFKDQTSWAPAR